MDMLFCTYGTTFPKPDTELSKDEHVNLRLYMERTE
jgi:hypothetical protein